MWRPSLRCCSAPWPSVTVVNSVCRPPVRVVWNRRIPWMGTRSKSLLANIGESAGIAAVVDHGAEGIGLLRTELIFMAHQSAPDEAARGNCRKVLDGLDGRPLVVRTLDVGGVVFKFCCWNNGC